MKYTIQDVYDNHDEYIDKILNHYIFDFTLHQDMKQDIYIGFMKVLPNKDFDINLSTVVNLNVKWYCLDYLKKIKLDTVSVHGLRSYPINWSYNDDYNFLDEGKIMAMLEPKIRTLKKNNSKYYGYIFLKSGI